MAADAAAIETRARRAYEYGRVRLGLRRAAVVLPMAALSVFACGRPTASCLTALILAACVLVFEWRGQALGGGGRIGLLAGLPPLLLPLLLQAGGVVCSQSFCTFYPIACVAGGIVGGVFLGLSGARRGLTAPGLASAAVIAALCGTLGCLIGGMTGLLGLLIGLGAGVTPVLVYRRA